MQVPNKHITDLLFSNQRIREEKILKTHDTQVFFEVGDSVWFQKSMDERLFGTIEKLSSKTCSVLAKDHQVWSVPYLLLVHVDQSLFDQRAHRAKRLLDVAIRARQMMDEHGLKSWYLYFSQARRMLGKCAFREKSIYISRYHAVYYEPMQVDDTILHEIAHALAGLEAGHGPKWKEIARRIGATPKARAYEKDKRDADMKSLLYAKSRFRTGDIVSFCSKDKIFVGRIMRMNPKRAKINCDNKGLFSVPYTLLKHCKDSD